MTVASSHCSFALLPTYYLIKAIYLNSQPGYQWPNKGTSDNAFFYSNLIGFLYEEEISTCISKRN
jgi:hypothetical protein